MFYKKIKNVKIISPQNTFIEKGAQIGYGSIIYPNNYIKNDVKIGKNCILLPNNFITSSTIGDNCTIGPFAHLRPNTVLKNEVKIGNFCEIKNSTINSYTKVSHLTYIGDATIGEHCNIGCGVIFANYNGKIKQNTTIGNDCFIGSNSTLIAPLNIQDNCFIGANTTLTQSLNKNTFALSQRSDLKLKPNKFASSYKK